MAIRVLDVLFVGMNKASYIGAIDAIDAWTRDNNIPMGRTNITYFDAGFGNAASLASRLPDLSVIYISNEVQMQSIVMQASCRKLVQNLLGLTDKPLIVLDESALDVVDVFAEHGFKVDLKPDTGTVEEALKTLIMETEKA